MVLRLALVVALLALLAFVDAPEQTLFWIALFDAGHALLFGVVALLVRGLLDLMRPATGGARASAQAFCATLVLAAASEIVQLFQPARDASVGDFLRDSAGAAASLLFHLVLTRSGPAGGRRGTRLGLVLSTCGVSLLVAVAVPFLRVVDTYRQRNRAFPTLVALDGSSWERQFLSTGGADLVRGVGPSATGWAGGPTALLNLRPGTYSGLVLDEPYPDWRGFKRLVLPVFSDDDVPLTLTVRVHDAWHNQRLDDRFNQRFVVTRGPHLIVIPLDDVRRAPRGREMDLGRIRGIVLFAYRLGRPAHVYLGPFRLE